MKIQYERAFRKPVANVVESSSNLINAGSLSWLRGENDVWKIENNF